MAGAAGQHTEPTGPGALPDRRTNGIRDEPDHYFTIVASFVIAPGDFPRYFTGLITI